MKRFIIKLDTLYYCGEGNQITSRKNASGWHETYKEQSNVLIGIRADAKVIVGYTNLNSHWKRIYDAMRYKELDVSKIQILELGN